MTEWILITMICVRTCEPQYAESYPSKSACMTKIVNPQSVFKAPNSYCVPLVKDKNT